MTGKIKCNILGETGHFVCKKLCGLKLSWVSLESDIPVKCVSIQFPCTTVWYCGMISINEINCRFNPAYTNNEKFDDFLDFIKHS